MNGTGQGGTTAAPAGRRRLRGTAPGARRLGRGAARAVSAIVLAVVLAAALATVLATVLALSARPVALPRWATDRIEAAVDDRWPGARVQIGGARLRLGPAPGLELHNLRLRDPSGARLGQIARVSFAFGARDLLEGRRVPRRLDLAGAEITLRRAADGSLALGFGGGDAPPAGAPGDLLARLGAAFAAEPFALVETVTATGVTVALEDARSGRVWQATEGVLRLSNGPDSVETGLRAELFNGSDALTPVEFTLQLRKRDGAGAVSARIERFPAADLAAHSPALAPFVLLDAPVSGAVRSEIAPGGRVGRLSAALQLGAGTLAPRPGVAAAFTGGDLYLDYDPARARIEVPQFRFAGRALSLAGSGHAYIREPAAGGPADFLVQLAFDEVRAVSEEMLAGPLAFDGGWADLRLGLAPFRADLGQLVLVKGARRLQARGQASAGAAGWEVRADLEAARLTVGEVLALWPLAATPRLRAWLDANLPRGTLTGLRAALRRDPLGGPRLGLSFDYSGAEIGYLPGMPAITGAAGHAAVDGDRFAVRLDRGRVAGVAVGGSSFVIPDLRARPPRGELDLHAEGPLGRLLRTLDSPPLGLLAKAGRTPEIAEGQAAVHSRIAFPIRRLAPGEIAHLTTGTLADVVSLRAVPGRRLTAERLGLRVDPAGLILAGPVRLDGVAADITATLPLGAGRGPGRIAGMVEITPAALDAFAIALPEGMLTGKGRGAIDIALDGPAPRLSLTSDLAGIGLALPAIGWTLSRPATGRFALEARLGTPPVVERLSLDAGGLSAEGTVTLSEAGGFASARFTRARVGDWLDSAVTLTARGPGAPPGVALEGGRVNLARRPESGGGGGGGAPLSLDIDRLEITEGIALAPFRGSFETRAGGLDGSFSGRVNRGAAVAGTAAPANGATTIRLEGDDAGRILKDAGLFGSLDTGTLALSLVPREGAAGFDGQLLIERARLRDQPILVDMLDAVSVVGLIDQLEGPGVLFDRVEAEFRLTDDRLVVERGSAVGASLGVSLDGVYDLARKTLDMGGVVSPIYLVNSIGSIFTRRGEGLFGFTFRLAGSPSAPEVSVNPLSILTPGVFREIFRRPPPERGR